MLLSHFLHSAPYHAQKLRACPGPTLAPALKQPREEEGKGLSCSALISCVFLGLAVLLT